jgi:hypothetical protein
MERLKHIQHKLIELVEMEVNEHLENIDACELGEVIDMIKDISETIYYHTVTEAMEDKSYREEPHHKVEELLHKA